MSPVKAPTFLPAGRRADILTAALECFSERGYEATSVEEIRRRCGASNGSFYHFFSSKRDVASALFIEYSQMYTQRLHDVCSELRTARRVVISLATFAIHWAFEDEPEFARVAATMLRSEIVDPVDPALRPLVASMRRDEWELYDKFAQRGEVKRLHPELLHPVLFGPAEAYVILRLRDATTVEPSDAATALGEVAWRALRT
jgi:AcrR family transcriptional regulator